MAFPSKADHTDVDLDFIRDNIDLACKAAENLQFKTAQGYLQLVLNKFPGMKGALRKFNNTLTSIVEGLADSALTRAGAKIEVKQANKELQADLESQIVKLNNPTTYDPDSLYKELNHDALKTYDTNMNEIQTKLNKHGIFAGYVPVLVITQPNLDVAKLNAHGITAEAFAGYPILKKEFVAGITNEGLKKLMTSEPKGAAALDKAEADALDSFRELINTRYKSLRLSPLGEPMGWWGATWIWYGTQKEYAQLKLCTYGNGGASSLQIKKWSFPFDRHATKVTKV